MEFYASQNPNIKFVHETYGENKIQHVLEKIQAYRKSAEYQHYKRIQDLKAEIYAKKQKDVSMLIILRTGPE
jgi:hypothetical protein